jgi:hypothetical protein
MYTNYFGSIFFVTNTLGVNAYKTFTCDKNQVPYFNVQGFKKWFVKESGVIYWTYSHWINLLFLLS